MKHDTDQLATDALQLAAHAEAFAKLCDANGDVEGARRERSLALLLRAQADEWSPAVARGWKEIADHVGASVDTAQKYALQSIDPLPVFVDHLGTGAKVSAIRAWIVRQRVPYRVAVRSKRAG